jgi:hypothetical protein
MYDKATPSPHRTLTPQAADGADLLIFCAPHQFIHNICKQLKGKARLARRRRRRLRPATTHPPHMMPRLAHPARLPMPRSRLPSVCPTPCGSIP